ncbi:MAG TPA: hypothetical protein VK686_25555 [Bryobacteraceae bacterium]|jgi:hypothetical protein|nr:hypothetical protein [Bryobacteraceae bacterium]
MRSTLVVFGAIVAGALIAASGANASTGPIPLNCDRACLEGVMNQYLEALAARDPKRLPLSADFKYTENDQPMELGDGFWKTVESVGNYKHIFADPEFGQVAFMGTMHEAGTPLLMSVRLRIELGRISEIEAIYFRQGGGGPANIGALDKPGYKPEDMWFKSIPPAQRLLRPEIISIADAYFSGLEKNDGKGVNGTGTYPFTNDCDRIENGSHTTNVPRPPNEPKDTINGFALDCMSQFKLGYYFVVQAIHDRRYPLVDAERGIVFTHVVFDQGTVSSGILSDGRPYKFPFFKSPSSILVTEAFLIEDRKIRRVEMIGPSAFYHLHSPWGGVSGH